MPNFERVTISGKEIFVSEIKVKHAREIWEKASGAGLSMTWLVEYGQHIFSECVKGLTVEDLMEFTPSELSELWDVFQRVNDRFFLLIEKMGIRALVMDLWENMVASVKNTIQKHLIIAFAGLSGPGTETVSITPGDSSSTP